MKAWTIIISDRDGAMWMNTEEAHSAEEATVQGLATFTAETTGYYPEDVADVIAIPGSLQDEAAWQVNDAARQRELLEAAASLLKEEATR